MRAARRSLKPVPPSIPVTRLRVRRTQAERSNEAQSILIDVAIQHIREKGLAYVTMSEIADQAGMTRGAIQHHFGSRDDYIRAVSTSLTDRVARILDRQPPADKGSPERVVRHCIETLGQIVLSRDQLAVTDISISSRSVPLLLADSERMSIRMRDMYAAAWRRWLGDRYSPAGIEKGFLIFSTMFSGMLVINYGKSEPENYETMLALCTELVENALMSS
jgi:AcrR family transcriptional regulator